MYDLLKDVAKRPKPFSRHTTAALWTRPHLAQRMLAVHLDPDSDRASYRFDVIEQIVSWLDSQLKLSGKRICDLGCGPGLYAQRFANAGAEVVGVDFSEHSLMYARSEAEQNAQPIRYLHADYLVDELPTGFDIVTLIFTDLCVLSPVQRQTLLTRIRDMLNPGGRIVLDVAGMSTFSEKVETTLIEDQPLGGFWASGEYVCIQRTFLYPEERLSLDRYLIVEPDETWEIFNWFQHYTPESIVAELQSAGFVIDQMVGSLSGEPLKSDSALIGLIVSIS